MLSRVSQTLLRTCLSGLTALGLLYGLSLSPVFAFTQPAGVDLPETIQVGATTYSLPHLDNPLRADKSKLKDHREAGAKLYFTHCYLCHGDLKDGRGVFGDRFRPAPANLRKLVIDPGKKENYAFWRIAKGGRGLPDTHRPWESAMPAWEGKLMPEEIWQVVLYIFDSVRHPFAPNTPVSASIERGQEVYQKHCLHCHGVKGDGQGVAAPFSSPRPRNFTKGHYKFRSTAFGKIPTDEDLHEMLVAGMPGTTMPSWQHLPEVDRESLVLYLKSLGRKFEKFKKRGKKHKVTQVPKPAPFTLESKERGRQLFITNCSGCHGVEGRSDGASTHKIVNIAKDQLRPRNLTQSWLFRRSHTRKDLFQTLRTGLSLTAMPRLSPRVHSDETVWDLVNYVYTLSPAVQPEVLEEMRAERIEGPLPQDPEDPAWRSVTAYFFPLGGQLEEEPKSYFTTTNSLWVQAVHNGREIAFRIRWDDPTFDPILKETAKVQESPPPPLPAHLQADTEDQPPPPKPEPQKIPDAFALQFPESPNSAVLPHFLNGEPGHPVTLWQWTSYPNQITEWSAEGAAHWSRKGMSQEVKGKVAFRYGQYQLVLRRAFATSDKERDIQFQPGQEVAIAFNSWDGNVGETGTKKAVSSWYKLVLE
ncbi:c-type cytochrome [Nitrospina gracilis]|uniref:c-type cytochrome n=1 Tax=Nitrospina gracilis TaxID=35801 RepID=UPI001EFFA720|nr:c-type cytochrome [Nitrospina gracilis]MCF8720832.1 mono/diheme cytochrome c family protein [Nitrospina gracilis Nb-211]